MTVSSLCVREMSGTKCMPCCGFKKYSAQTLSWAAKHRRPTATSATSLLRAVKYRHLCHSSKLTRPALPPGQIPSPREPYRAGRPDAIGPAKLETFGSSRESRDNQALNTDGLLSEQITSNQEQRKADWAIIKEMAQYLWPKVGQIPKSVIL